MSKALELLQELRELLSDPEKWTPDVAARTADGKAVDAEHVLAVKWGLGGGLMYVSSCVNNDQYFEAEDQLIAAGKALINSRADYVDVEDYELALKIIDKAIEFEEATNVSDGS